MRNRQATITLSFIAGTDPDEAVQQVQNQLQSAMRKTAAGGTGRGVTARKTAIPHFDHRFRLYRRFYGQVGYRRLRRQ